MSINNVTDFQQHFFMFQMKITPYILMLRENKDDPSVHKTYGVGGWIKKRVKVELISELKELESVYEKIKDLDPVECDFEYHINRHNETMNEIGLLEHMLTVDEKHEGKNKTNK